MFIQIMLLLVVAAGLIGLASLISTKLQRENSRLFALANFGEGEFAEGRLTKKLDAPITSQFLLCKAGTDADHVDICGAANEPIGVMRDDDLAIEDLCHVELLGIANRTLRVVASEAITAGSLVFTAANGKVQDQPAVAGTYFLIGRALTAAAADGDTLAIAHRPPLKVVVLALMGNTNSEISALTSSATTTQAEFNALRDKCEELADDLRAIQTATQGGPTLLLHLSA